MAQLPMRTAYWLWVLGSLVAAGLGAALLARALCPRVWIATTVILLTFEPLWHLVWWGQVDAFLFLPFAAGCALLLRARSPRDDLLAGALMASLALIPQYAIVPFLALAWARRWAAAGMAAGGGALALASVALVGGEGLEHYRDMVEYFGAFTGTATVTEWAMFNVRGVVMRQGGEWGLGHDTMLALVWALSLPLAALSVVAAGRALRPTRSPDLALSVVVLAALLTSYHTHRQTLVFFFVALAAFVGRSLRPGTPPWLALVWAAPVVAMHAVISQLHFNHPITFYPVQRYLTPPSIAVLLLLAAALLVPPVARRLDRAWSETGEADVAGAVPDAAPAGLAGGRSGAVAAGEA